MWGPRIELSCIRANPGHRRTGAALWRPDDGHEPENSDVAAVADGVQGPRALELRHVEGALDGAPDVPILVSPMLVRDEGDLGQQKGANVSPLKALRISRVSVAPLGFHKLVRLGPRCSSLFEVSKDGCFF